MSVVSGGINSQNCRLPGWAHDTKRISSMQTSFHSNWLEPVLFEIKIYPDYHIFRQSVLHMLYTYGSTRVGAASGSPPLFIGGGPE